MPLAVFAFGALLALSGCATPAPEPLDDARLAATVAGRAATPAELEAALAAAEASPLALPRPKFDDAAFSDADRPDFWRASAFAFDPATREARRALAAAVHRRGDAGLPGPLMLEADGVGFDTADREVEVALSFDLLGILGLGRSAAARLLAAAEERAALGRLERAVYAARFQAERAQVGLAAARATLETLRRLIAEDAADRPRRERLAAAGRIAAGDLAADAGVRADLARRLADAEGAEALARADLARAAGLPTEHPALDGVTPRALETAVRRAVEPGREPPSDDARALLAGRPDLREKKLAYAVAEARVRSAAAETQPGLRLGPKLVFVPDLVLAGGVLAAETPWPGAGQGEVRAALEERAAAREAVEDALVGARAEASAARGRLVALRRALDRVGEADVAAEDVWRAAALRFRLDLEPMSFLRRAEAFERRTTAALDVVATRAELALAALADAETHGAEDLR